MDSSFPFLLGLNGLAELGGIINTRRSQVDFLDLKSKDVSYDYQPTDSNNKAVKAAMTVETTMKAGTAGTHTAWASSVSVLLVATTDAGAKTTPDGWKNILDESFDDLVELHDKWPDPDAKPCGSHWDPIHSQRTSVAAGGVASKQSEQTSGDKQDEIITLKDLQTALADHPSMQTVAKVDSRTLHTPVMDPSDP